MFIGIDTSYQSSNISYKGANQYVDLNGDISYEPAETTSKLSVFNISAKAGIKKAVSNRADILGYGLLSYRFAKRDMKGEGGYGEYYHWGYLGLGLGFDFCLSYKLQTGVRLEGMYAPIKSKYFRSVYVELSKLDPDLKNINLSFGSTDGFRVKLPTIYKISNTISFEFEPFYEYWHADKTDWKDTTIEGLIASVPSNFTRNYGFLQVLDTISSKT